MNTVKLITAEPCAGHTPTKTDSELKLIDFGFSRQFFEEEGPRESQPTGTSMYMAPEVIQNSYTATSDLWSLGCDPASAPLPPANPLCYYGPKWFNFVLQRAHSCQH